MSSCPPQRLFVAFGGLSLAGCSSAEPASVSPAFDILVSGFMVVKIFSSGGLSFEFTGLAGGGEFGVSLGLDRFGAALEFVAGRDIADGAVQALVIIMVHKTGDDLAGVIQRQGRLRADTGAFNGFVITFQFAVALGVVG